jgi:hypothetical protein
MIRCFSTTALNKSRRTHLEDCVYRAFQLTGNIPRYINDRHQVLVVNALFDDCVFCDWWLAVLC